MNPELDVLRTTAGVVWGAISHYRSWSAALSVGVCASAVVAGSAFGQTLTPRKMLGKYQQHVWQDQHGLPHSSIRAVLRTRDGYLWLGTLEGAARFDGVRFTVFDSSTTAEIQSDVIAALLEDRAGSLWLATDNAGVARLARGRFTRYTTRDGLSSDNTRCLYEDRSGNLWIGTYNGGLNRLRNGSVVRYTTGEGMPSDDVRAITEDPAGSLWVATSGGLTRFQEGRFTVYTTQDGLPSQSVRSLLWDEDGYLWVGSDNQGACRFKDGRCTMLGAADGLVDQSVAVIAKDREGSIWIGTDGGGLFRCTDDRCARYTTRDGLPGDAVSAIYEDPERNLWIGTSGGLTQLREPRFRTYSVDDGLPHDFAGPVYEDTAGIRWIGGSAGLTRFQNGTFATYTTKDGLPSNSVMSITEDRSGRLWLGTRRGVAMFHGGRFASWTTRTGLSNDLAWAVFGDRTGNVWIGTSGGGLNRFRDGHFTVYTTRDGLADNYVLAMYEDREGALWIGTLNGGMSRYQHGRFTTWTTSDGLASNHVISFHQDRAGNLWIGTHGGGLSRLKDGRLASITASHGLYNNIVFQILEDDAGNLWMSCNKGIYRARLEELAEVADGRRDSVTSFSYGLADGMLSRECNGAQPAGWKTTDGTLWFPTMKGIVEVDPRRRDVDVPVVAIEQITVDREALPSTDVVHLRPGQDNLEIRYTGLSWARPQQVTFKYRMAGLDREWVDAGTRRVAYYSHLPPGEYVFEVVADNGEGVWNTKAGSLQILVLPPFYRTSWFTILAAFGVLALGVLAWHARIGRLQRAQATQQAFSRQLIASQERERKRIAAELHDGLGQHLLIIKNRAAMGVRVSRGHASASEQFDEIETAATQAIAEVRTITYNLRPMNLERLGLTVVLEEMIETAASTSGIEFVGDIASLDGCLTPDGEINIYRIIQESIANIVRHSHATRASIEVWRADDDLHITVRDNGRGFRDRPLNERTGGSTGAGLGLTDIAERTSMLAGTHTIVSSPDEGTTVTIRIPLPAPRDGGRS